MSSNKRKEKMEKKIEEVKQRIVDNDKQTRRQIADIVFNVKLKYLQIAKQQECIKDEMKKIESKESLYDENGKLISPLIQQIDVEGRKITIERLFFEVFEAQKDIQYLSPNSYEEIMTELNHFLIMLKDKGYIEI